MTGFINPKPARNRRTAQLRRLLRYNNNISRGVQ